MIPYAHYAKQNSEGMSELYGFRGVLSITVCF